MSRLATKPLHRLACVGAVIALLGACDEMPAIEWPFGAQPATASTGQTVLPPKPQVAAAEDSGEERPDIFAVSANGLWDGRPSLGGLWVAHPDVVTPERVIIRRPDNGAEATGALFRRSADLPGPAFQVSSEAAQALGILAGAPVMLEVIALRRSETPVDAAPIAEPVQASGDAPAAQPVDVDVPEVLPVASDSVKPIARPVNQPATAAQPPVIDVSAITGQAAGDLVLIGEFTDEADALRSAALVRESGIEASVERVASDGLALWRVIAGPTSLAAMRRLGFVNAALANDS